MARTTPQNPLTNRDGTNTYLPTAEKIVGIGESKSLLSKTYYPPHSLENLRILRKAPTQKSQLLNVVNREFLYSDTVLKLLFIYDNYIEIMVLFA